MEEKQDIKFYKNTIDLTGKRFGKLVVIELNHKTQKTLANGNKKSNYYWKCKCDCGKEVVKSGYALRHGISKSCGCTRTNNINRKIPDLIGKDLIN